MGLPALKDFLPPEDDSPQSDVLDLSDSFRRESAASRRSLDQEEQLLLAMERRLASQRAALDRFAREVIDSSSVTLEDVEDVLAQIVDEQTKTRALVNRDLRQIEQQRALFARLSSDEMRDRALHLMDRHSALLRATLDSFESAVEAIDRLRDRLLVYEAQSLSHATFWADDDE